MLRLFGVALLLVTSCSSRQPSLVLAPKPVSIISDAKPGVDIAKVALESGAFATAEHVVEGVLSENPDDVGALLVQAEAFRQAGDVVSAESSIRRAYGLRPRDIRVVTELGKVELAKDAQSAETTFRQALALDPNDQAALTDLGVSLDMQGEHKEAQSVYRKVLSLYGGSQLAVRVDLGLSLALTGDSQEAIEQLRPAAAMPNVNARVRQDLAAALTLSGDTKEAEAVLGHDMSQEQVASLISGYQALR